MCQMYGRKVKRGVSMEMRESERFSESYLQLTVTFSKAF